MTTGHPLAQEGPAPAHATHEVAKTMTAVPASDRADATPTPASAPVIVRCAARDPEAETPTHERVAAPRLATAGPAHHEAAGSGTRTTCRADGVLMVATHVAVPLARGQTRATRATCVADW